MPSGHISQLPTEILCEIFSNYLHIYSHEAPNNGIPHFFWQRKVPYVSEYSVSDPGVLTKVCSAWRKVALGYPALWSRILIFGPVKPHFRTMKLWLERANGHPLELTFKEYTLQLDKPVPIEVFQCLFEYSSTWKSIILQVESTSLEVISRMTESCQPCTNLEFAGLVIPSTPSIPGASPLVDKMWRFFHSSPVLRKVILPPLRNNTLFPHTPTLQLTSVILLSYGTIADLILVISRCPLLEQAETKFLTPVSRQTDSFMQTSTMTHQNLQKLSIISTFPTELDGLFGGITLPCLKILTLKHAIPQFATFRDFLRRSKCRLQEFTFQLEGDLEPYIRLEELESLTVLQVTKANVTDRVIELLLQSNSKSEDGPFQYEFLPRLEVLHLSVWQASDGMLSHFFSARLCVPAKQDHMIDLSDESNIPRPNQRGRLAFSFEPPPDGPIDGGFVKQNYEWLGEVYQRMDFYRCFNVDDDA